MKISLAFNLVVVLCVLSMSHMRQQHANIDQNPSERGFRLINTTELGKRKMLFYHLQHSRHVPLSIPIDLKYQHHRFVALLLVSGDISTNPGPDRCTYPPADTHTSSLQELPFFNISDDEFHEIPR